MTPRSHSSIISAPPAWLLHLADYWTLTKPEVNSLVLASTLAGFYLAGRGATNGWLLFHTLLGTLLVASGTGTLNQYLECSTDSRMRRTAKRPLPAGRLKPSHALAFGTVISILGGSQLWIAANPLASALALGTLASYLAFYTPLKRLTPFCTLVGAVPGAMPPLIGWAAVRGSVSGEAWVLAGILFLWQFPHLLAIAWMYRDDYARAGLQMLARRDPEGRLMIRQILGCTLALVPLSLAPVFTGNAGALYLAGALILGGAFLYYGLRLAAARSNVFARQLLFASIAYLPLVLALLMIDRRPM